MDDFIKADDWIKAVIPILESGMLVKIMPEGGSMLPFITGGRDYVFLKKIDRPIKRGDILLYRRETGNYVLHRVHHVNEKGIYMLGDAQRTLEGPLSPECVVAMCDEYIKKGRKKNNNSWDMKIKYNIWMWIKPLRAGLIKLNSWRRDWLHI